MPSEDPITPVVSRKESLSKRRRRKRKISVLSDESDDDSSARPSTSVDDEVFRPTQKTQQVDKYKLESMLKQVDDEIDTRIATAQTMREQYTASLKRQLNRQLLRLPSKVKKMTVKEWKEVYNDDLNKLAKMQATAREENVDRIILQALNPNTIKSNENNSGKAPKSSTFTKPSSSSASSTPPSKKTLTASSVNRSAVKQPAKKKARMDPDLVNMIQGKSREDVENIQKFLQDYMKMLQ